MLRGTRRDREIEMQETAYVTRVAASSNEQYEKAMSLLNGKVRDEAREAMESVMKFLGAK